MHDGSGLYDGAFLSSGQFKQPGFAARIKLQRGLEMAVFDLYSKRKKRLASQGKADVYQYDTIPGPLRVQIAQVVQDALGCWYIRDPGYYDLRPNSPSSRWWQEIHDAIARENGVWHLGKNGSNPDIRCIEHFLSADTDGALDFIELCFKVINFGIRKFAPVDLEHARVRVSADDAIEELNQRFREAGVGFQFTEGKIIRVDSEFLHSEAVKPALALLHEAGFTGPADEFIRAFDHHRKCENKDAIADASNAFESTMKAICDAQGWKYQTKDTAKSLLDVLFNNELIPAELASHFAGLRSAMESGLPTLANRTSRHGQGTKPTEVPDHYVAYALHLVASNIVFLIGCHNALN